MPFEHNLRRLLNLTETKMDFPALWWTNIDFLSQYYLNARYKEDITVLQQKITAKVAMEFLSFAEEVSEWCIARIRSIE